MKTNLQVTLLSMFMLLVVNVLSAQNQKSPKTTGHYGSISLYNEAPVNMLAGNLAADSWQIIEGFAAEQLSSWTLTNNELVSTAAASGDYFVNFSLSFSSTAGAYTVGLFLNNELISDVYSTRKISSSGGLSEMGNVSGSGIVTGITNSDRISLRFKSDAIVSDFRPYFAQVNVVEAKASSSASFAEMKIKDNLAGPTSTNGQTLTNNGEYYPITDFSEVETSTDWSYSENTLVAGTGSAGKYLVTASCSFGATNDERFYFSIVKKGTTEAGFGRYISGSQDYGNAMGSIILNIAEDEIIELKAKRIGGTSAIKLQIAQAGLTLIKLQGDVVANSANMRIIEGSEEIVLPSGSTTWIQETHFEEGTLNYGWDFLPYPDGELTPSAAVSNPLHYLVTYSVSISYFENDDQAIFPEIALFVGNTRVSTILRKLQKKDDGDVASATGTAIVEIDNIADKLSIRALEWEGTNRSIILKSANINALSLSAIDQPEIALYGGAALDQPILDGSTQVSVDNSTVFPVTMTPSTLEEPYVEIYIKNEGTADLIINGVSFSNSSGNFAINTPSSFPTAIVAGNSTTLKIYFSPQSDQTGILSDVVEIACNDYDESTFTFTIMGKKTGTYFVTWDGGAGTTNWSDAANWSGDAVPIKDMHVVIEGANVIINPSSTSQVGTPAPADCYNLYVASSASLTVKSSANVTASLWIRGTLFAENITVERYLTGGIYHYISSPIDYRNTEVHFADINSSAGVNLGLSTNNIYDNFWRFAEHTATGGGRWIDLIHNSGEYSRMGVETFFRGMGYAYSNGHNPTTDPATTISFTGLINQEDVDISVTRSSTTGGGDGFNLVGNPFTSDLRIKNGEYTETGFIEDNLGLLDDKYAAAYLWVEDAANVWTGNYKAISNSKYTTGTANGSINQNFIESGQGFMIKVESDVDIHFNRTQQGHGGVGENFYKNEEKSWPGVDLTLSSTMPEIRERSTAIFTQYDGMTLGLDPSYDAGIMESGNLDLYSSLVEDNGYNFEIQALPIDFEGTLVIPIGITLSNPGSYMFTANSVDIYGDAAYLEDTETDELISLDELLAGYEVEISESGYGRFYLHLKSVLGTEDLTASDPINIYAHNKNIYIESETNSSEIASLYDISGRLVLQQPLDGKQTIIHTDLPFGSYIVKVGTSAEHIVIR